MRPISKLVLLLTAVAAVAALVSVPLSGASDARGANAFVLPKLRTVTLITGDVVHVATRRDGKRSVSLQPGSDGTIPTASITEAGRHLYVVPQAASRLLAAKRLDLDLFDVAGLVEQRYDDAHRQTLPVIVDYGRGAPAAAKARSATLRHATKTHALPIFGASAFSADKRQARGFWRSLTASPDRTGAPTALAGGATRVDLDGRVHAVLDHSVPQIHAPEAWAAGYDGAGSKVAVLDTGIDATHPDLAGQVSTAANFSTEDSVVDGNGHGTHVASTIAGTGAASSGLRKGVAPGARLLVGKVLDNNGSGEDSWVMAGMQWAASSGADVVNMSLGGDIGDGTDPLSQAINDLSASTATLFVVAAGNNGSDASTVTAPGAARAALTVGAVDDNDALAWFSSRGPLVGGAGVKPDVVAPGVDITAARAAGTSLGNPVDDYYTDLSGTSMATPHVSGVAAILKEEHPAWDGERLKEAITASAVPIAGASAYEAGTGRVDALRAIHQTVISDDSLDLGYYPYPQSALSPTHTALGYTNLGSAPVTLHLAVASEDGSAGLSGISVSPSELTIPAGGQASADVTVDPAQVGTGSVSGVIDAQADGGVDVRTAFGLVLESEHYNLTVQVDPRRGTQHATHTIGLLGLDTFTYDQREITGQGPQSVTFRVVPGTYAVGGITFGLAADGASEGVLSYQPSVDVHSNQTVVLDGNAARQFRYRTDRPVVSNGQIMTVTWNGAAGFAGFTLAGAVDRLYAQPLDASSGGEVESQLNWMLSQPDAELASPRGPVSLRALTAPGGRAWSVPGAAGLFRLVDAGSSANLRTQGVKQAVAVVSGACDDLTAAVSSLKGAGAVAVIAYAGPGADCAGSLTATPPLP
ncbi:MAG TPA: S8 family peptidase, partial [Vicinamibacteria bacterium]|nr:S8 family peptidase [Vicinamibacteria bacterium]